MKPSFQHLFHVEVAICIVRTVEFLKIMYWVAILRKQKNEIPEGFLIHPGSSRRSAFKPKVLIPIPVSIKIFSL